MSGAARKHSYTWDDFVALPEDDLRELIDGELVEVEVPGLLHEHIVIALGSFLRGYVRRRGGIVLASGYKVRISEHRGLMPDIQLFRADNEPGSEFEVGLSEGRPDLAVEIMSPSSRRFDRMVKLAYYASIGVPEYWIVDPAGKAIERLVLVDGAYAIASIHEGHAVFAPPSFRGVRVPLDELWRDRPKARAKRSKRRAAR
jgi:Uma2 family endonuclease